METSEAQIKFDPTTGQIVEYVPQQVSGDAFETRLQDAANHMASTLSELTNAENDHNAALQEVERLYQIVESRRTAVTEAEVALAFQERRKAQYDAAVAASQAAPAESPTDVADGSEEVAIPTRVAESFPV